MVERSSDILDRIKARTDAKRPRVIILAAHPDDEVIGAGGMMAFWDVAAVVYLTDGCPPGIEDSTWAGFNSREGYRAARWKESADALALCGIGPERMKGLGSTDQRSAFHLKELAQEFAGLVQGLGAEAIITHAYEGGHPDHDSAALIASVVRSSVSPTVCGIEMQSHYPVQRSGFLARNAVGPEVMAIQVELTAAERRRKRRMLNCFRTQRRVLRGVDVSNEEFAVAPAYDFTVPPGTGPLYYEQFAWGISGADFCARAAELLAVPLKSS